MNDDRYTVDHLVVVAHDNTHDRSGRDHAAERSRAECSCGWTGDWHMGAALADLEADDHREVVVGPGDRFDRLMGELLDLQDDLARVVVWLAEHWSADLPVPVARGAGSDTAPLDVWVCCLDPGHLAEAARLLGVALVEDPWPDSRGARYRRAVRRFGRVRFEAFRRIDPTCSGCGTETAETVCPTCGQRVDARSVTLEVAS